MTKTLWEHEAEFIHCIAKMKRIGIKVDKEFCYPRIQKGITICRDIRDNLGWNPGSPKQLGEFLLNKMGYPVVRRTKNGNPSFDKFALEEYEEMLEADGSDLAQQVLRYRGWQKTVSSNYQAYVNLADKDDIIHPNYKVHGTRTCRTSCENPNLQQIPKGSVKEWNGEVKKAFIPRHELLLPWETETVLVNFDFAQLETRLAAAAAKETQLLEAFYDGIDIFDVMAETLGWTRDACKTLNYATLYGAGVKRIAMLFKVDHKIARGLIEEFFNSYPLLKKKIKLATAVAKNQGYIQYWTGRRRHLNGSLGQEHHKAFNAYIQGGAFEIVKRSGVRLEATIPWPIVLTVHDSYTVEMPIQDYTEENCLWIKHTLEAVPEAKEMGVPFKVDQEQWGVK